MRVQQRDARAGFRRADRGGEPRGAGADDGDVARGGGARDWSGSGRRTQDRAVVAGAGNSR